MLLRRRSREVIELSEQSAAQMRHVRGADMAMIFQEPMTSLNPVFTVGEQIAESIRLHQNASREEAMVEAKRMLDQVRIPEAQTILSRYPHQFLWRDAPASDDCDGAVMPPGGADCR
ncbi:glutathione transporter ATP-binding protein [Escherichia coli]|nr:glutathione transporter ATP-binding protein [Escherichia coli]